MPIFESKWRQIERYFKKQRILSTMSKQTILLCLLQKKYCTHFSIIITFIIKKNLTRQGEKKQGQFHIDKHPIQVKAKVNIW